ncbi:MAG TPA: ribonuclease III [Acidobacteriaceae bacterium]|jgi:ribonuclease-3
MTTRRKRKNSGSEELEAKPVGVAALEERLGWQFRKQDLLQLALTHRSFAYEARGATTEAAVPGKNAPGEDNEQLEFLGDAVLGLAVTEALFREFPDRSEGELTRMRASLVSRESMAHMGEAMELGDLLLLGRSADRGGSRRKPALLANAAEAILGAVYLDAGEQGPQVVRAIVDRLLTRPALPALRAALAHDAGRGALRDGKTLLQERVQAAGAGKLRYVDTGQSGPAHERLFAVEARLENETGVRVLASAEGSSKKEAQQRAAALALEHWGLTMKNEPVRGAA